MMSQLFMALLGCISLCHASEIAPSGPLVYPSWPPKSSSQKPLLHQHIQSQPHHRHQMVYQMRPNSASSRYSQSVQLQSPSNLVYTQSKQRTYPQQQQQPHMTMLVQPHQQQSSQHNRIVIRPPSSKITQSGGAGLAHHFMMPSAKPSSPHHMHHMSSTATHPIFFKKPQMTPVKSSFHGSNSGHKSGGEYTFENPFINSAGSIPTTSALTGSFSHQQKHVLGTPSTSTLSVGNHHHQQLSQPQNKHKYSPIHTINAPNLSLHEQKPFADFVNGPVETNYILEKDPSSNQMSYPHIAFTPQRPSFVHQYQVTEPTNDFTIRDSHTGKQTLYAPDPDPSLPSYQIKPVSDPYSRPSLFPQQFGHQPAASALIQQQVYPAAANLRQTINTQTAYLQPQPHSKSPIYEPQMDMQPVYNPTYLVTQSNQLLSQHKQHLFKPDPVYLQQSQHPTAVRPDNEFLPSYQLQPTTLNEEPQFQQHHQNHQISQPLDEPQFARLMAAAPIQHHHTIIHPSPPAASPQQRPSLTEKEVSNLMNFGRLDGTPNDSNQNQQTGFVASSFFQTGPNDSSDGSGPTLDDVFKHQQNNEERIVEATRQAFNEQKPFKHKKTGSEAIGRDTIFVTKSPEQKKNDATETVHQKSQQQRLADHFSSDLRIYVPDNADQSDNFQKRSDDFDSNGDDDTDREFDNETTVEFESLRSDTLPTTTHASAIDAESLIQSGDSISATEILASATVEPTNSISETVTNRS